MHRSLVELLCVVGIVGTVVGCGLRAPSVASASDDAVVVARALEAALAAADGWRAVSLCRLTPACRPDGSCPGAPGMAPRRLARGPGIEVVGWRPSPRGFPNGLGTLCGSYAEVYQARVRLAEVRGRGGRLRVRLHLRALGRAADGRLREDDGYLWVDLRRLPAGRWRIVGLLPEDLVTALRREPAFREHTRTTGLQLPPRTPRGPVLPPTIPTGAGLAAADLDGDGRVDLVVPGPEGCAIFKNHPEGRFRLVRRVPCAADARGVAAADLGGDGHPDLLVPRPEDPWSSGVGAGT